MHARTPCLLACLAVLGGFSSARAVISVGQPEVGLTWDELPPLPPAPGQDEQPGLAGPFVGVHEGALLVAGGANFPNAVPWRGGQKVWWDHVYVLSHRDDGTYEWFTSPELRLPRPTAYGVSVSTPAGVICVGGSSGNRSLADVVLLAWQPETKTISIKELPSLPRPLSAMGGALVGETIYLAGGVTGPGATKTFLALDLTERGDAEAFAWKALPPWPGPPRILPVVAAQSNGNDDCLYVISGRHAQTGKPTELLYDAYAFNPRVYDAEGRPSEGTAAWTRLADVGTNPLIDEDPNETRTCVMAAPGIRAGVNHVLVFGGADGDLFLKLEGLSAQIRRAKQAGLTDRVAELERAKARIHETHPGFSKRILAYHTVTDTWTDVGELPEAGAVTTAAIRWDKQIVIPSGEVKPGVRTPRVWSARAPMAPRFGWPNYGVLVVYLAALVYMGFYFARREKSTDDFFKAGGRVPWWAAGLSIFGTSLSAITFMAIPCKTFATDWRYMGANLAQLVGAPIVIVLFLPFYRRLNVTTAYEYLEKRFNVVARLLGSTMFLLFQFGRIGIVLYLPSIALSVVTGVPISACIMVMGVLSITYTVLGGIEAVVWTDVLQVIVLMGGALLSLILIALNVDDGFSGILSVGLANDKLHTFDLSPSVVTPTLWAVFFGGLATNLVVAGSDQTMVQRYLTTKDERGAARGLWTHAIMTIPATLLFFGLGTALYVFYKSHPETLNPTMANADAIFPWYIVTQLPTGVSGVLIAGLFAAAMSSLDSSMNSSATAITTDFYRRFRPNADDHTCLTLARWITVVVGTAGTAFALWMAASGGEIKSLWDEFSKVLGLLTGGLGGMFMLGVLFRRAHGVGAIIGLLGSGVVQYFVSQGGYVHLLLYTMTGMVSCIVIGYVASLAIPTRGKSIEGLTLYTVGKAHD